MAADQSEGGSSPPARSSSILGSVIKFGLLAAILAAAFSGYSWYQARNTALMETPPLGSGGVSIPTKVSTVGATIDLPFSALTEAANQAAPANFSRNGSDEKCEHVFGAKVCLGVSYEFAVTRNGAIGIGTSATIPNGFQIAVPLSFAGSAGFRGDLAKVLDLDKKNFSGAITVYVDAAVSIDPNWCPSITPSIRFDWQQKARIEIIGGVWIPISSLLDKPLRDAAEKVGPALAAAIDCAKIKSDVEKLWAPRTIPIKAPGVGQVYVNLEPESIGFSGLVVDPQKLSFAVSMGVKADATLVPKTAAAKPLPPLQTIPLKESKVAVAFPVRVDYGAIEKAAVGALKGKQFSKDTPAGVVKIKVDEIKVYPSGTRLVVGANVTADLPSQLFDTKGWVYFFAEPVPEGGNVIVLKDAGFSRALNSSFWNIASSVFEGPIRDELKKVSRIELAPQFAELEKAIQAAVKDIEAKNPVSLVLSNIVLGISNISPAAEALEVEAAFSANVKAGLVAGGGK